MNQLNPENFFENTGGGAGAPSLSVKELNDGAIGEIVDQFMTEAKVFASDDIKRDKKTGEPIMQLVVILQTDLRNWDRVARIPWVDPNDQSKGQKPASEDDGKRALYVEPWTNIHAAIGQAVQEGTGKKGPLLNGAKLGVKIVELRDTGKGNPLKVWKAVYTPPAASSSFFDESKTAGGSGDASAASQPQSAPATQQDPWSGQQVQPQSPPF